MISWIQRTFQHHFRLIFGLLLVGMIVPFIFTIGATPGIGRADRQAINQDYFGHNLASKEELRQIVSDARMSAFLQIGSYPPEEQVQFYGFQRIAALHLADELHLPPATPVEIEDFIKHLRIFSGPDGQFDVSRYDALRSAWKANGSSSEADVARVVADDARASTVETLLGGPGYLLPGDVNSIILKGDTDWTIATATVDYGSFDPSVRLTDADLSKYFADNSFRYQVAPRVSVDCIDFPAAAYLGQVGAPPPSEVRGFYDSNPSRFPAPARAKAALAKSDPDADFAAVEPQVRLALQLEKAKQSAVKAGSDLAYALFDAKVARGAPLAAFLAERKLAPRSLAPFTLESGPAELGGSREISGAAFELNSERYYSEALPSAEGAVVLIWKDSLPSRQPLLSEVRDKVRADALDNEKRKEFVELGRALKAGIERRLREGESFEKAAAEAGDRVRVTVKAYPTFTLRSQPSDLDPAAAGALVRLEKGGVSDMETTAEKGVIVYVADKKPPVLNEAGLRYAQLRIQMARAYSRPEAVSILEDLAQQELKRSKAAIE